MALEIWKCESCGGTNQSEMHGVIKCAYCDSIYVVTNDEEAPTQKTTDEWLASINSQLIELNKKLKDAEEFRKKEKHVLGEIETILHRLR